MDYVDWLRRASIASERAYRDTYQFVIEHNATMRETFEYARAAARSHNRLAKGQPGGYGAMCRIWGSQYRDIALYLLHHLRKAA